MGLRFAITPGFLPTNDMGQAITARRDVPENIWQSADLAAELIAQADQIVRRDELALRLRRFGEGK